MEQIIERDNQPVFTAEDLIPAVLSELKLLPSSTPFIEANTIESSLSEIQQEHIIPVFIKDNEPVISHAEFIQCASDCVMNAFRGQVISHPHIRLSHPIKGRIPEAKNKAAKDLLDHERTLYFERMAFIIEVPSIHTDIMGNKVNLTVGGVKAYNLDNLYSKSGADQHFKVFVGFKNKVCTNLCVSTDGLLGNLKVKSLEMLQQQILILLRDFNAIQFAEQLQAFGQYDISESQFAHLIGRCRMYRHLPEPEKAHIPELLFGDSHVNAICKDYYSNSDFCKSSDGSLNLWRLYNLLTGANKSSYIDSFLDRSVNAFTLTRELQMSLQNGADCWFLN